MAKARPKDWQTLRLEDICEHITDGKHGDCHNQARSGYYFLSCKDVANGRLNYESARQIAKSDFYDAHRRTKLAPFDVLITNSGTIGRMAIAPDNELTRRTTFQKSVAILKPIASCVEPIFLYHALQVEVSRLVDFAGGTAQKNLLLRDLRSFELTIPPLPIQRRIAGILSAYDDLIENSQRRIKILEEMARRLYREWFVHFHFPGHEGCRFVDSPLGEIPEGWEVKPFSAIANYVNGYPFKPAELGPAGKPIVKIKELKAGIVADTPRNTGDNIPGKYHILDGDVLFSWSADLDAYLWMGGDGLLNQHLFTVLPADAFSRAFCFHSLKGSMPRFRALSLGATMHHIKRSALDQVFTVVAPAPMRKRFDVLVEPIHQQLITISKQIQNLRQSRDLLLPRLLSGLIDIESLPEPVLSEP
jgi:type I restriction enzyme S subunit